MEGTSRNNSFPYLPPNTGQDVTPSSGSSHLSLTPSPSHQSVQSSRSAPLVGTVSRNHSPFNSFVPQFGGTIHQYTNNVQGYREIPTIQTGVPNLTGSLPPETNSSWPVSGVVGANSSLVPNTGAWSAPTTGQFQTASARSRDSGSSNSSGGSGGDYTQILDNEEGWDLVFVPQRSEKFDCPICLLVLREPMQTECGHRFCRACILKWLRESDTRCPVDNQPLDERQLFPDNFAKREILTLTVKCPNHTKGCDQIIVLKHLQTHLDNCVFSLIPCPNECASVLLRGQLSDHLLNECPKRIIKCSLCQADLVAEKHQEHLDSECPQAMINCPSCDLQLKRQLLTKHINTECKKSTAKCQYQLLGCQYEGERETLDDHETSNLPYHMGLINLSIIRLFTMLGINPRNFHSANSSSTLNCQPTEGEATSGAASYPSYFVNPRDSMALLQNLFQQLNLTPNDLNNVAVNDLNLSQSLTQSGSSFNSMQSNGMNVLYASPGSVSIATAQNLLTPVSQAISGQSIPEEQQVESEHANSNQTRYQTLSYTSEPSERHDNKEVPFMSVSESRLHTIKCQNDIQDESLARHDQQLLELSHQRDYQERVIRDLKSRVRSLESKMQDIEGRCGNGVYVWCIKNYLKSRREAERGELSAIHSNSFYSSFYGYKLCIRVNLNGVDTAKGSHLSLFIHFMQGEYDDLLEWPFSGKIILTIIDQNPICELRNHISETLLSKPNLAAFQRPVSARNHKGFGYMEFLPFNVIDGSTYVKNDTLIIKAMVLPSNT